MQSKLPPLPPAAVRWYPTVRVCARSTYQDAAHTRELRNIDSWFEASRVIVCLSHQCATPRETSVPCCRVAYFYFCVNFFVKGYVRRLQQRTCFELPMYYSSVDVKEQRTILNCVTSLGALASSVPVLSNILCQFAVVVLVIDQTFSSLTCSNFGFHHERAQGSLLSSEFYLYTLLKLYTYLTILAEVTFIVVLTFAAAVAV